MATTVDVLQQILCDSVVLTYKLRNFHWNLKDKNFLDIHSFLGDEYDATDEFIDNVAERIRAMRVNPISKLEKFVSEANLKEEDIVDYSAQNVLSKLLVDYEQVIAFITSNYVIVDRTTENFLQEHVFKMQKSAWKIRSILGI